MRPDSAESKIAVQRDLLIESEIINYELRIMDREGFSQINLTKGKPPRLPFVEIKEKVLGKKYNLSLVFISEAKIKELNKKYRQKNKVANILSFPLSSESGEIFISLARAKKEQQKFKKNFSDFILFLFIHGLLHLKGMDHGEAMDEKEEYYYSKFKNQKSKIKK